MSEKLSINVKVVGLNVTHNFIVPDDMNSAKMLQLMAKTIQEEYPGASFDKERSHFLMHESGKVINSGCSLKQSGVVNGEKFILI
jgi:hypothetical protein